jgi:hypothetical protein
MLIECMNQLAEDIGQSFSAFGSGVCAPRASRPICFGIQSFDVFVLTFHQMDDRSNFPRPTIEQLRPQVHVFAVVMRIQEEAQNVDVLANYPRSFYVTGLHVPYQIRQRAELPPKRRVHHVHVAGIRVRATTACHFFLPMIFVRGRQHAIGISQERALRHAMFAARGRASAAVDSRGPLVDSVQAVEPHPRASSAAAPML